MQRCLCIALLGLPSLLPAQLFKEAFKTFPADTVSLEYDNLQALRKLPNYSQLRSQYSSEPLQRAQKMLASLGIAESQLTEVVTASGPNGFFGTFTGAFSMDRPASCSNQDVCFWFSNIGWFGSRRQMQAVLSVERGAAKGLVSNQRMLEMAKHFDSRIPVFGIAPGNEISAWIGDGLPSQLNLTGLLSNIELFSYGMKIDAKAHASMDLLCKSETTGRLVADGLGAAGRLQRMASIFPFENLTVDSSGRNVFLTFDAALQFR